MVVVLWFHACVQGSVPEHIRAAAQRSAAAAQLRSAHEVAVSADKAADATLLAAYMAYVQVGNKQLQHWFAPSLVRVAC